MRATALRKLRRNTLRYNFHAASYNKVYTYNAAHTPGDIKMLQEATLYSCTHVFLAPRRHTLISHPPAAIKSLERREGSMVKRHVEKRKIARAMHF